MVGASQQQLAAPCVFKVSRLSSPCAWPHAFKLTSLQAPASCWLCLLLAPCAAQLGAQRSPQKPATPTAPLQITIDLTADILKGHTLRELSE